MKVEDIRVGVSATTGRFHAGTLNCQSSRWLQYVDVTDDFVHAVIERYSGKVETVTRDDGRQFEITVREVHK